MIFFTYFSGTTENAIATIENNQTNQLVTQEKGGENNKIVQQGVLTSSPDPLPGHEAHQSVTILLLKGDNTVYEGTLSFVASKPVEVHTKNLDLGMSPLSLSILNKISLGRDIPNILLLNLFKFIRYIL